MQIDLTFEQATALGKAVGLVLEQLDVSECERKAFKLAQEALYAGIGWNEILENAQKDMTQLGNFLLYETRPKSYYAHCGEEYRGKFNYWRKDGEVWIYLLIYRFADAESVEVVCGEVRVPAEELGDILWYLPFTWRPTARSGEQYSFAAPLGTHISVKIVTPTTVKEATYLVTEQNVEEQSDTIWLEITDLT